ncbi:MAG TPA: transferase [Blastocatellia bacterium]|nr:transferase [Blastocatellia bacterium]
MRDIIILGAGGLARETAFLIDEINRHSATWTILGFADADERSLGAQIGKHKIICTEDSLLEMKVAAAIGIGDPKTLAKITARLQDRPNVSFPNLVHPNVVWDRERIEMGEGNIVCAGSIFTTDIRIGSFNFFNLNCTYGHDIRIASHCVFNPGINLSGGVEIGSRCLIGTGATILQYLTIGDDVTVGAGSVVTKSVASGTTVIGIPAKPLAPKDERA